MYTFGELLKRFRKSQVISQENLAHILGVHRNSISDWERDNYLPRSRQMILDLSEALDLDQTGTDQLLRASDYSMEYYNLSVSHSFPQNLGVENTGDEYPDPIQENTFVAREAELDEMNQILSGILQERDGTVAFLRGEAGSGKTALVQSFSQAAMHSNSDLLVVSGCCSAYDGVGDPYLPFREILGKLTFNSKEGWLDNSLDGQFYSRLQSLIPLALKTIAYSGHDLVETILPGPSLLTTGVSISPGAAWLENLKALVAQKTTERIQSNIHQKNLFEQYTRLMQVLSQNRPLVLVLDDLQWADNGTIGLLFHLGKRLKRCPVLLLGVYRQEDIYIGRSGDRHPLEAVINEFQLEYGNSLIDLDRTEAKHFIRSILNVEQNDFDDQFHDVFYQHTRGNALFTIETLRRMQRKGDIHQDRNGRWVEGPKLDWQTIPERVDGIIRERIDRLPAPLKETLKIASIEGGEFHAEVIAEILGRDEWYVARQLSDVLDRQHHIVTSKNTSRLGNQRISHYRFHHILFQIYLYNSLDKVEKEILHERIGYSLERLYSERTDGIAVQLARHFKEANIHDKAVDYLIQAGTLAIHMSANEEALNHFHSALQLLVENKNYKRAISQELKLQISLGQVYVALKGEGAPELKQTYSRAFELVNIEGKSLDMLQVIFGHWAYLYAKADLKGSLKLGNQLFDIATTRENQLLLLNAHRIISSTLFALGKFSTALSHNKKCRELYEKEETRHQGKIVFRNNYKVLNPSYGSIILWALGYPEQAKESSRHAIAIASDNKVIRPYSLSFAFVMSGIFHVLSGQEKIVNERADSLLSIATKYELSQWIVVGVILKGWALNRFDRSFGEIEKMKLALEELKASGSNLIVPFYRMLIAEALQLNGQLKESESALDEALQDVNANDERWFEPELHRMRAELMMKRGKIDADVEEALYQSLEVSREQEAKSWELRTLLSLYNLRNKQGRAAEAIPVLREKYNSFTEGFDTPDMKKAEKILK